MNAPQKIAAFGFSLPVVFAAAFGVGTTLGPEGGEANAAHRQSDEDGSVGAQDVAASELSLRKRRSTPVSNSPCAFGLPAQWAPR